MTEAIRYIELYQKRCEFNHWFWCEPCMDYHEWKDGREACAVYVSDDSRQCAIYICIDCAKQAETGGDGPVFYVWPESERW